MPRPPTQTIRCEMLKVSRLMQFMQTKLYLEKTRALFYAQRVSRRIETSCTEGSPV